MYQIRPACAPTETENYEAINHELYASNDVYQLLIEWQLYLSQTSDVDRKCTCDITACCCSGYLRPHPSIRLHNYSVVMS